MKNAKPSNNYYDFHNFLMKPIEVTKRTWHIDHVDIFKFLARFILLLTLGIRV